MTRCWFCGHFIKDHAHYPGPAHCGCPLKPLREKLTMQRPVKGSAGIAPAPWQQLTRLGALVES